MLTNTKLIVKRVVGMNGWCDSQHSVVIYSFIRHASIWVGTMVCALRSIVRCTYRQWCVDCGWWRCVALVIASMTLSSACVPLCQSPYSPLTTHTRVRLQKSIWRPRRPGDLPSCIGWVFGASSQVFHSIRKRICGHLAVNRLTVFQPHNLQREMLGLSCYGLKPERVICLLSVHNQQLWASASEPTGSVPTTQSPERKVGTIVLWPLARVC